MTVVTVDDGRPGPFHVGRDTQTVPRVTLFPLGPVTIFGVPHTGGHQNAPSVVLVEIRTVAPLWRPRTTHR